METTTAQSTGPIVRPEIAARVSVTFPGSDLRDTETIAGLVVRADGDSFDVLPDCGMFRDAWTLFDTEQADARCVVTVL